MSFISKAKWVRVFPPFVKFWGSFSTSFFVEIEKRMKLRRFVWAIDPNHPFLKVQICYGKFHSPNKKVELDLTIEAKVDRATLAKSPTNHMSLRPLCLFLSTQLLYLLLFSWLDNFFFFVKSLLYPFLQKITRNNFYKVNKK